MHIPRTNTVRLAKLMPEPIRVQKRARAHDPIGRETRELLCRVRQDVARVRGDDEDRVRRVPGDLWDDRLKKTVVRLEQIQARLAGFLVHAGRDDDGCCAGAILVGADADARLVEVRCMVEVAHFAFCAGHVDVDEDNVRCEVGEEEGKGCGCSY